MTPEPARWLWLLFPAVTMSLGWGLRGFIGGGEMGAMIPGALVALSLCLLLRRNSLDDVAIIAAVGAIGVAFGGQETYGQTIGLSLDPPTRWWGLLGLAIKGAKWGLAGGAFIGLAFDWRDRRPAFNRVAIGLAIFVALTYAFWWFINHPRLIYFSNRLDRPREEMWAGLFAGALGLLLWMRSPVMWRFAGWAALGGWFGFGGGGWLQVMGRTYANTPWIGYWKVMELFFGLLFGLALGHAAWTMRAQLRAAQESPSPGPCSLALDILAGAAAAAFALAIGVFEWQSLLGRVGFTALGAAAIRLALQSTLASWHLAITTTIAAFAFDFVEHEKFTGAAPYAIAAALAVPLSIYIIRRASLLPVFVWLLWSSNLDSYIKSWYRGFTWDGHAITEIVFTLLGIAATWMAFRIGAPANREA